jgi:hydrogenase maturation protein HypF
MAERAQISITGIVQGVGFRPYVHALAARFGLQGNVSNTASGVLIDAEGERLQEFLECLPREAPPLARIARISITKLPLQGYTTFSIKDSKDLPGAFTLLSPDVAVCAECLQELRDPRDRRYRYPFINCTNCGPRYSITRAVPYDRPSTTMAPFRMCPECDREYHDPADRRFHAQPNACPKCGPQVEFRARGAEYGVKGPEALVQCVKALQDGGIVAVKGLGGFHLACDAGNDAAVRTLRERKRRSNKPFAVMAPSVEAVSRFCAETDEERTLLLSSRRPIVLLRRKEGDHQLSEQVAPNNQYIGVMLPYTPLHELLFLPPVPEAEAASNFTALVMTSGNLSEEPIVRDNDEAVGKLGSLADAFLFHDRDIFMRVDDSVIRVTSDERREAGGTESLSDTGGSSLVTRPLSLSFIRRSRGYAPDPIQLETDGPEVLGCGADLKNTFTLTKGAWAVPSQHIGDMENYETLRFFEETFENLKQVYRVRPVAVAHDLHPGYLSTRWAQERDAKAAEDGFQGTFAIQHHYAHIGSVMAEHGITGRVIGVAFDGTGYGTDGNLWGGEFLVADSDGFERAGQLAYLPLPGGEAAIREPWRTAVSLVRAAVGQDAFEALQRCGLVDRQGEQNVRQVLAIADAPQLSPLASGAGRYFDALASLLGLCDRNTFEGEAAMTLESLVLDGREDHYPVDYKEENGYTEVVLSPLVRSVLDDISGGTDKRIIATRFHNAFAGVIAAVAGRISERTGIRDVALSGGTFQNRYLLERSTELLRSSGLVVHRNHQMPSNDACISLGQAYLVRERLKKRESPSREQGT